MLPIQDDEGTAEISVIFIKTVDNEAFYTLK